MAPRPMKIGVPPGNSCRAGYTVSPRRYHDLPDLTYPFHDRDALVTNCGRLCLHRKKINISIVLAGVSGSDN
jgi:hypothetical protein